jgi:hypothetical protein
VQHLIKEFTVTPKTGLAKVAESISYRVQLLLLTFFGPAQQDDETDPIHQLKRKYNRLPKSE